MTILINAPPCHNRPRMDCRLVMSPDIKDSRMDCSYLPISYNVHPKVLGIIYSFLDCGIWFCMVHDLSSLYFSSVFFTFSPFIVSNSSAVFIKKAFWLCPALISPGGLF